MAVITFKPDEKKRKILDTKLTSLVPVLRRTQFIWKYSYTKLYTVLRSKLNSICTYGIMLIIVNDHCLNNISVWRYYKKLLLVSDNKKPYFYFSIMMLHINTARTTHVQFSWNIKTFLKYVFLFNIYKLYAVVGPLWL